MTTMQTLLNTITQILNGTSTNGVPDNNGLIAWVGSIIECITQNDLLLLFVVMAVALIAIGVVKRLIRL